jgi:transcriptional regulator of arginine metabolism
VSRDLRELGIVKRAGVYTPPDAAASAPVIDDYASTIGAFLRTFGVVGEHLVVIHTLPGTAHSVAFYLDTISWPGVAGTVAGDDTIFAAVQDRAAARRLVRRLSRIREANP